jgi:hypothetical protein
MNACRIMVGSPEGMRPTGRYFRSSENNIKLDLREILWDGMNWIGLPQDRDQWGRGGALVYTVMHLPFP